MALLTKMSQSVGAVVPEQVCLRQPFELSETVTLVETNVHDNSTETQEEILCNIEVNLTRKKWTSCRGVASGGARGAGRTRRHLLGAANWRKL